MSVGRWEGEVEQYTKEKFPLCPEVHGSIVERNLVLTNLLFHQKYLYLRFSIMCDAKYVICLNKLKLFTISHTYTSGVISTLHDDVNTERVRRRMNVKIKW